jgi:hypothetical protein
VRALLERAGELGKLAEDYATVPFGVRNVLAILLVRGFGCQRKSGDAAVVVGADFSIAAEEADEIYFVLIHDVSPFVEFPDLARVTQGEAKRVGLAPKCQVVLSWRAPFREEP